MTVIRVSEDPVGMAAELLAAAVRLRVETFGMARVAIPGGSAMRAWLKVAESLGDLLELVCMTWVDERCVAHADRASNRGELHRHTIARAGIEVPLWRDGDSVEEALTRVRGELTTHFEDRLDVVLLGMGGDGHIASVFPGRVIDADRIAHVSDSPKPPPMRMTLTRSLLATAATTVLLATGEPKRAALERVLAADPQLPATGLPNLTIVTDLELRSPE